MRSVLWFTRGRRPGPTPTPRRPGVLLVDVEVPYLDGMASDVKISNDVLVDHNGVKLGPDSVGAPRTVNHLRSGQWYAPEFLARGTSGASGDDLRVAPLLVPEDARIDRLRCNVNSAGGVGASGRMVVYADDGSGRPGALVGVSAAVALDSTGIKEAAVDLAVARGLIWTGLVRQDAALTAPNLHVVSEAHYTPAANSLNRAAGWSQTGVAGEPPAAFEGTAVVTNVPLVQVRIA